VNAGISLCPDACLDSCHPGAEENKINNQICQGKHIKKRKNNNNPYKAQGKTSCIANGRGKQKKQKSREGCYATVLLLGSIHVQWLLAVCLIPGTGRPTWYCSRYDIKLCQSPGDIPGGPGYQCYKMT